MNWFCSSNLYKASPKHISETEKNIYTSRAFNPCQHINGFLICRLMFRCQKCVERIFVLHQMCLHFYRATLFSLCFWFESTWLFWVLILKFDLELSRQRIRRLDEGRGHLIHRCDTNLYCIYIM